MVHTYKNTSTFSGFVICSDKISQPTGQELYSFLSISTCTLLPFLNSLPQAACLNSKINLKSIYDYEKLKFVAERHFPKSRGLIFQNTALKI
jgi:hypothetical protein